MLMKSCWLFSCRNVGKISFFAIKLSTRCSSPPHSRPEEDWNIRSNRRQDKFLCYQVVYKKTVSNFSWSQEQLRIHLENLYAYIFDTATGVAPRSWSGTSRNDYTIYAYIVHTLYLMLCAVWYYRLYHRYIVEYPEIRTCMQFKLGMSFMYEAAIQSTSSILCTCLAYSGTLISACFFQIVQQPTYQAGIKTTH